MNISGVNSNYLRLVYDLLSLIFTSLFVYFFHSMAKIPVELMPLVLAPIVVMGSNLALGIFSYNRLASGVKKVGIIAASVILGAGAMLLVSETFSSAVLFSFIVFPLLALPRYFVNLNRTDSSFVSRVLDDKGVVLIVGGAGYIGTHVVDVLLNSNFKVRVLDRLMYNRATIKDFEGNPNFQFVEGDATDISKLVEAMTGASAVVHLAGLVGDPACAVDKDFTRHTNVISTRMVKDVALSAGVSRFIFASSCSVYGANDDVVSETSDLNPVSLYAVTKIDSERELLNTQNEDFHPTILRFATVFGHSRRPRFDLVGNLFTAQAFNEKRMNVVGPAQWRPFVHCRDLARAIEKVLRAPVSKVHGQIFNVGDENLNMTIGDLANKVAEVAKQNQAEVRMDISENVSDRRNYRVSFKKIKNVLGFEAEYTIEKGVAEIWSQFQKGSYGDYKTKAYSNLEMTKIQVNSFYDPLQTTNIYRPVSDNLKTTEA
ncbi:MAG: NAD-dependent epimerase/dehydratase family protein [Bdellovibrionaceae bacterium]|nr:NAD-dependent epimerase/dehydratase family protein [Pseudobdellovibrionaceae bacterium]